MKPSVAIWTTSHVKYDQRIQRIISTIESLNGTVTIWDRKSSSVHGKIQPRWNRGPAFYLDYNWQIAELAGKHKADLFYAADIDVMPGLMWGLRGANKSPLLLDLHEWYPEVIELEGKPLKREIWRWVERRSVQFASKHMTVNHSLKHVFENQYGIPFTVIRNVPNVKPNLNLNPRTRLENKILYYQGAMNKGRGLETAVSSLHLLPGWKLWLVGEGDILEKLRDKVRVEGLDERVEFYGRRLPEELPVLAGQATVGLNLLGDHSKSYYYSLANKYFDYIHAGLPSIHMDFPEYQTLINEFCVGCLLSDLSPHVLADVVQHVTSDNNQYINMIEQCDVAKSTYNWEEESKVLVELIENIIGLR